MFERTTVVSTNSDSTHSTTLLNNFEASNVAGLTFSFHSDTNAFSQPTSLALPSIRFRDVAIVIVGACKSLPALHAPPAKIKQNLKPFALGEKTTGRFTALLPCRRRLVEAKAAALW